VLNTVKDPLSKHKFGSLPREKFDERKAKTKTGKAHHKFQVVFQRERGSEKDSDSNRGITYSASDEFGRVLS
jgi:hypothetical protein